MKMNDVDGISGAGFQRAEWLHLGGQIQGGSGGLEFLLVFEETCIRGKHSATGLKPCEMTDGMR